MSLSLNLLILMNKGKTDMKLKDSLLIASLFLAPQVAVSWTITPDGNYVGGNSWTMTPDGNYVGGNSWEMTPNGGYVGRYNSPPQQYYSQPSNAGWGAITNSAGNSGAALGQALGSLFGGR